MVDDKGQQCKQCDNDSDGECLEAQTRRFMPTDLRQSVTGNDGFPVEQLLFLFIVATAPVMGCASVVRAVSVVRIGVVIRFGWVGLSVPSVRMETSSAIGTEVDAVANAFAAMRAKVHSRCRHCVSALFSGRVQRALLDRLIGGQALWTHHQAVAERQFLERHIQLFSALWTQSFQIE